LNAGQASYADAHFVHPAGTRIACALEYDGSTYNGWQSQPHDGVSTVQDALEAALSQIADQSVRVHCAGRTDTGVHATAQTVHFDAPAPRSIRAWTQGVNTALPPDIRVHWAVAVAPEFHARFSATARRYRYLVANVPVRPALLRNLVTWHRRELDAERMHRAAQCLLGEQDFSAFRAASCQANSAMRNVLSVQVTRMGNFVEINICANAFLHHMVRNIAGSLLAVGDGRQAEPWIGELLQGRDRTAAADTAPPTGLYLCEIQYPEAFALPETNSMPIWYDSRLVFSG